MGIAGEGEASHHERSVGPCTRELGIGNKARTKKGNDSYDDPYRSNGYGYPVGS
jgi:hypothetical protein